MLISLSPYKINQRNELSENSTQYISTPSPQNV